MAGHAKVTSKDHGYQALLTRLKGKERKLTVGVHEAEGALPHESESTEHATVADVAKWMEFGTVDIDPRSFLAGWVDESEAKIKEDLRKAAAAVVSGKLPSMEIALERLGLKFVGDIRARIRAGIEPALADSTIERKGSSTPLINTGQLQSSILHKVE